MSAAEAMPSALITRAPVRCGDRGAERRALVAVELDVVSPIASTRVRDLVERRVDEHPTGSTRRRSARGDPGGDGRVGARAGARPKINPSAHAPSSTASAASSSRVMPQILTLGHGRSS